MSSVPERRGARTGILNPGWLTGPAFLILLLVFLYPVCWLLLRSVLEPSIGLQNFAVVFKGAPYLRVLTNTVVVSASATSICLVLGYLVAYQIAHASALVRRLLIFMVLVPFWTSVLVRTFGWMVILQQKGLINSAFMGLGLIKAPFSLIHNRTGVLIGMIHVLLPFMILPLYTVMTRIDRFYLDAAASLGATPLRQFVRVYLPLSLPGVVSGCVLVFVMGLGYFITPALLGGAGDIMIAQVIDQQVAEFGAWGVASALSVILLISVGVTFAFMQRLVSRGDFA
jgi:putative spermidine/putrescine transport system permease protein